MADKTISERIGELLAKKLAGEITEDEQQELHALLQEHSYVSYVNEVLEHGWKDKHDYYQADKIALLYQKHQQRLSLAMQEEQVAAEPLIEDDKKTRVKKIWLYTAAACLAFAFFAGWKWWPEKKELTVAAYQKQVVTQKGNRSQIVLPDGSKVWLNAGSTLDYPQKFSGSTRDVELEGEAYFEVTKNKGKPFFVHTRAFSVKVLGTGFNVRAYADEDSAVTALVHGAVEVSVKGDKNKSFLLQPNEKITLPTFAINNALQKQNVEQLLVTNRISPEKMVVMEDSLQVETAWVNNKLAFKKLPLADIAMMLEKWFGTTIRFKKEEKEMLRLSGVYEGENLDEILYSLQIASGNKFSYKKDTEDITWIE